VAASHHENIDGSGYHRGLTASQLTIPARVVATASAYVETCESESNREPEQVLSRLRLRGTIDPDCLAALAADIGTVSYFAPPKRAWPAELTDREVAVLRCVASGCSLKETAKRLVISDHTARHHLHLESVYSKAGVSSRAGVTLFAVENGILS